MQLSRYLKVYPSKTRPDHFLLFSTLRTSTVQLPGAALRAAQGGGDLGPEADTLRRLGILVDDPAIEREQMRTLLERFDARSRRFDAIVVLNLDCNLDCGYCYEECFRGEQYMSEATAQLLVETLVRDHLSAGKNLLITFYGGEPLLSEDLIVRISLPLREAAQLHRVDYSFALVTNGTLLNRESAQRLIPLGLKGAKFTLDGPQEIHDQQRPYASGSGSFETIVDNIASIWDLVPISLGGNFYQDSYRAFPRLLDQLVDRGITPEKISQVLFTPVTPKAGCAEYSSGCANSGEPWLIEALSYLRQEIMSRGFATSRPTVSACMVEVADNMVVNCDGSLYKCPAFMGWEGFQIGTIARGVTDYAESHGIGNWQNDDCLDCPYLPICFGGCRFLNLLQGKAVSEVDCRRGFLDATLETFILQNMTYPRPKPASDSAERIQGAI
ncbi:MAG: putative geopeptide radical SAM maturase [Geobacteraceae bacterium GWC2_58_44]|nr:MAG: putative geopeptide radical SAM maturase [Geobacteraceae bacterium GWC2_58_44]HBG04194.1 putative geopeptide radical SAM maturase [Geobacter sp.]